MLVVSVDYEGSAWGQLRSGDVILEMDGHPIANNGTVQYQERLRTGFGVLLSDRLVGEAVSTKILRNGRPMHVELELKPFRPLVPRWQYDASPSYWVHGGLVFQRLSLDLIATWHDWWENAPPELLHFLKAGIRTEEQQEVVVLSNVLADEINVGYERLANEPIVSVQGRTPRTLKHFTEILRSAASTIEMRTSRGGLIVLDPAAVTAANSRVAQRYRVQRLCSLDLE